MSSRINRALELLAQDQAIYYVGGHSGHVLTHSQGCQDARTWADYINVGMEHGSFDMAGLAEYMRGLVDGAPTRSGHRTPTIVVGPERTEQLRTQLGLKAGDAVFFVAGDPAVFVKFAGPARSKATG